MARFRREFTEQTCSSNIVLDVEQGSPSLWKGPGMAATHPPLIEICIHTKLCGLTEHK